MVSLPSPPDDRHERGEEGDEGQEPEREGDFTRQQGVAMGDVVRRHVRHRRGDRSCALQHVMDREEEAEQQRADSGRSQG
jgi:hypothetical protein